MGRIPPAMHGSSFTKLGVLVIGAVCFFHFLACRGLGPGGQGAEIVEDWAVNREVRRNDWFRPFQKRNRKKKSGGHELQGRIKPDWRGRQGGIKGRLTAGGREEQIKRPRGAAEKRKDLRSDGTGVVKGNV